MLDFLLANDTLSAIAAFILVLIPAVFIHELGHFIAAKRVGITILEFGIGMPPRMIKLFTLRGTDYTLNWLPLGGFVRPLGEDIVRQMGDDALQSDRDVARARGIEKPTSVADARPLGRIFFMAGGALANFIFAFVLFTLIALGGIPQFVGGRVNVIDVDAASPFAQAGLQAGDAIETVNGQLFQDSAQFAEQLQTIDGQTVTFGYRRAGEDDVLTGEAPLTLGAGTAASHPMVNALIQDAPAQAAGIEPGDVIVAFNGVSMSDVAMLQATTRQHLGETITLTLQRGGETVEVELIPRANPPDNQGSMGISINDAIVDPRFGVVYAAGTNQSQLVPLALGDAMRYSLTRIGEVFNSVFSIPGQLLRGTAQPESLRLTSPLGISQIGGVFLQDSVRLNQPSIILEFIALINVALGLTNLLPIPALDGGRILFVLIEVLRGKPIAPEREGMVHLIGLAVLFSLMFIVLLNDIRDPLTNLVR